MIKGNKGEWSEFYAFLKILVEGKVFTADKDLNLLRDNYYIVLQIIRDEAGGRKIYDLSEDASTVRIIDNSNNSKDVVDLGQLKNGVVKIFNEIKKTRGSSFEINPAVELMRELHCSQIKASSLQKADLKLVLDDKKFPSPVELGFSIKSRLGAPSTLLNPSKATNFVYKIVESDSTNEDALSSYDDFKVRDRGQHMYNAGWHLEYRSMDNDVFRKNLRKIDSNFPQIIAEILKRYYRDGSVKVSDLVDRIAEDHDFCTRLDLDRDDFVFKVKRFLSDVALGMTPSDKWDGYTKAHGGYIVVKEDGDVACYHIFDRNQFEDYLFNNTKLDTPSTSRYDFGDIYEEDGERRIKYCLQIRFIK